jgi:hypothetical protein
MYVCVNVCEHMSVCVCICVYVFVCVCVLRRISGALNNVEMVEMLS